MSAEDKQKYLKSQIIDLNYDPNKFADFLEAKKADGANIDNWSMESLEEQVVAYQEEEDFKKEKALQEIPLFAESKVIQNGTERLPNTYPNKLCSSSAYHSFNSQVELPKTDLETF